MILNLERCKLLVVFFIGNLHEDDLDFILRGLLLDSIGEFRSKLGSYYFICNMFKKWVDI